MRKITLLTLLLIASYGVFSQSTHTVEYFNWSNPNTFNLSPSPVITGYGFYSDSLSEVFDDKTFYEYNNEYYCIESWADYYYWFTQRFSYQFSDPQLYEYYYWVKDDYGMASYIASYKYLGKYYPSLIKLNFGDLSVKNNRLINDKFFAQNDKKIERFNKQLQTTKDESNNTNIEYKRRYEAPEIFKKDQFRNNKLENNSHRIEAPKTLKSPDSKYNSKNSDKTNK